MMFQKVTRYYSSRLFLSAILRYLILSQLVLLPMKLYFLQNNFKYKSKIKNISPNLLSITKYKLTKSLIQRSQGKQFFSMPIERFINSRLWILAKHYINQALLFIMQKEEVQHSNNNRLLEDRMPPEETSYENIIKITKQIIKTMTEGQRFQKAKAHVMDALYYKHPRYESQSLGTTKAFRIAYAVHSNYVWSWLMFIGSYVYIGTAAIDSEHFRIKLAIELSLLILFWIDTFMQAYCKQFDTYKGENRFSHIYIFKCCIILLMTVDLIIFVCLPCQDSRPIRPFRILRSFLPFIFDPEIRKTLISLASAYMDILVYFIFFSTVIVGYALLGNRALAFDPSYVDPNYPQHVDPYKSNYGDLLHMIFHVYVTASYDAYPDNQILAIQNYEPNYIYYIVFVFANMFLFSSIPGTIIFLVFKERRSKILLADELKQQHSLMLAYVTLTENESNLSIDKLIKFLLYLYKYKIRYVEYITDICLKLDSNNNRSIQINEFMQFARILLDNEAMLPPRFDDFEPWLQFRMYINDKLYLKQILRHWIFDLTISIIIILSFINAIFFMFAYSKLTETFDGIFVWTFLVELLMRIVAIGPENFFTERWNIVDSVLVMVGLLFFFVPNQNNADGIARMSRIFRLANLLRLVSHSRLLKGMKFQIWTKLANMYSILLQIMSIILRFMPLFVFVFYIYSIIGMELFYNFYTTPGNPSYNQYIEYGNFKTLAAGMEYMVMVLTEAGWSSVAYDHCWRAPQYFTYIMLYFCLLHITIVYMIATLIKGIFWEVFFTVNTIFAARDKNSVEEEAKQQEIIQKTKEIQNINNAIESGVWLEPDSVIKRQLIENKFDQQIFRKLKKYYDAEAIKKKLKSRRSVLTQRIMDDWEIDVNELELSQDAREKYYKKPQLWHHQSTQKIELGQIEEIDDEDFQSELSEMLNKLVVNPKIKYSQIVASPKVFIDFLKSKLVSPQDLISDGEFDLHSHPLHSRDSMYYLVYQIHALLGIETSKRQQKAMIIKSLVEENVLSDEQAERLVKKKLQEKIFHIDTSGVLRKLFTSGVNRDLIKKFQIEYFSEIYGQSYTRINKMTMEPLLRLQATITHSLRTILRYPQITNAQFFEMLTSIEDQISNKLLQNGSLFKFLYKLDFQGDVWFSVEYKRQQEMKVHFLKTGIWCYFKEMTAGNVLYAKDVFNWPLAEGCDRNLCEQYIKRFFQSFEGLAFSLLDEDEFFSSNPQFYVYDLYLQHFDVEKTKRYNNCKLEVSKIMVVILSKEEERSSVGLAPLPYQLSDIKIHAPKQKKKRGINFDFNDPDDDTFDNLKKVQANDEQKIVESEGLPLSFIVDLMKEISDFVTLYAQNFVYQIQKVLNEEYEEMNNQAESPASPIIKQPVTANERLNRLNLNADFRLENPPSGQEMII